MCKKSEAEEKSYAGDYHAARLKGGVPDEKVLFSSKGGYIKCTKLNRTPPDAAKASLFRKLLKQEEIA